MKTNTIGLQLLQGKVSEGFLAMITILQKIIPKTKLSHQQSLSKSTESLINAILFKDNHGALARLKEIRDVLLTEEIREYVICRTWIDDILKKRMNIIKNKLVVYDTKEKKFNDSWNYLEQQLRDNNLIETKSSARSTAKSIPPVQQLLKKGTHSGRFKGKHSLTEIDKIRTPTKK